jgi:hypothetical protein
LIGICEKQDIFGVIPVMLRRSEIASVTITPMMTMKSKLLSEGSLEDIESHVQSEQHFQRTL